MFFAITFAFPFLLFLLLELALRFISYGPNLALFTTEVLVGQTYTVMNAEAKSRYFSRVSFNPSTSPDYFLEPKPPGTFRIFCLGGSTTVGYPYWYNGSFSSFLRDRLRRVFPDRQIEVLNVGMTATNSFTVNDMAEELVHHEPDLFVVYDGHNEFYGALGVSSNESLGGSRWITKLYLKAVHLKTFLMLQDVLARIRLLFAPDGVESTGGTMMEKLASGQVIPHDSPLYKAGLETYQGNLRDLKSLCASHKIPLLLGSQVSNLRELPPFVSKHSPGLSAEKVQKCDSLYRRALLEFGEGDIQAALSLFEAAGHIDSTMAEVHFQVGRCLDSLGRDQEALRAYILARDCDQLRFRMSSDFNLAMKNECTDNGAVYVDIEKAFMENSPDSLMGFNLFFEHLHPNALGYFLMGREYARSMREHGLIASRSDWETRDTIDEESLWEQRPITELDERLAVRRTEILTSGWPFISQTPVVSPVAPDDTLGQVVELVTRAKWNWLQAHNAAADHYLRRGEWRNAEREFRTITNQLPLLESDPYLKLARLYIGSSRFSEAEQELKSSLKIKPTILAYRALADLAMNGGHSPLAAAYYAKTFSFTQTQRELVENGYLFALALYRSEKTEQASSELLKVLNLKPDHQAAVELLAKINGKK